MGEHHHTASPNIDLTTHILDITNFLEFEDLRNVILVGHSYGGMVITGAAEQSSRIGKLVYLDAIVPEHGENAFSLINGLEEDFRARADANGMVPPWPPQRYGVTDPADIAWMNARLTATPILTHREKLNAPKMKAKTLPRYFVHCTQFSLGGQFAAKIRRDGATVYGLDTGHDAMITEPKKLASILHTISSS
jgi:pimeloyl-ACP methyl ester carboxylesterase